MLCSIGKNAARRARFASIIVGVAIGGCATTTGAPPADASPDDPPALSAISQEDLRRDLFVLASQAMRGRAGQGAAVEPLVAYGAQHNAARTCHVGNSPRKAELRDHIVRSAFSQEFGARGGTGLAR